MLELIREYLVDMEFIALGRDGTSIGAHPVVNKDNIFETFDVEVLGSTYVNKGRD